MNDMLNFKKFKVGQVIEGEVIQVTDNEVMVNFGDVTEGTMYLNQLTLKEVTSAKEVVQVGDKIKAKIKKRTDEEIFLSRIDIEKEQMVHKLENKFHHKNVVSGKVVSEQKTAFIVNIYGVDCILPKNEVDVDPNFDTKDLVEQTIKVKIIEVNTTKRRPKVVVSRRKVIAGELFKERLNKYKAIEKDAIYEGEVIRVERYGLLVVANNYQGLVPLREISHLPFDDINDVAKVGDKVNVKVVDKNEDKLQVLYSMKALLPKPWEVVAENMKEGDIIEGTVVRITDFGAFVNVYPLVDGLLHKSEYSYKPNVNMFDHIEEGQKINVKVIRMDINRERLSLSVRALKDNPWESVNLHERDIVEMKVIDFTNGDAVVEYDEDITGILPKSHVSSERRVTKAEEELTVGQVIKVKILDFKKYDRKLVVSIRRIKEDADRQEYVKYMKENEHEEMKQNTLGDMFGDKLDQLKDALKDEEK